MVDTEMVTMANLDDVLKIAEKMRRVDFPLRESASTLDEHKKALSDFRSQTTSFIRSLYVAVEDLKATAENNAAKTSVADLFLPKHPSCRLNLDDAETVLRNLTQTTSMDAPRFSMKDFQALVDRNVRSLIGT